MALEARRENRKYGPSALVTPSNGITFVRIAATPVFVALVLSRGPSMGLVLTWAILSATDKVDGWLARRQGPTRSGAFLDPLADKLVVLGAMGALVAVDRLWFLPVGLIAFREVAMTIYRSYVGRRGVSVPARTSAKLKTALQDVVVGVALVPAFGTGYVRFVSIVLWLSVLLTLATGLQYLTDGRRVISRLNSSVES